MPNHEKLMPDLSILSEGILSEKISKKELNPGEIVIHEAIIAFLEREANQNKAIGFLGMDELKRLRSIRGITLSFTGKRPTQFELTHADEGAVNAQVRELALQSSATLITSDKVQAGIAEAKAMNVLYIKPGGVKKSLKLESFFDETTMSVHLRESVEPYAKKGVPGSWQFIAIRKQKLTQEEIQDISREIIEAAKLRKDSFIEIERPGSTIVQLANYRIVITKTPFSDGWEITAVRPVKRLSLDDYRLSEKLRERIATQAEGILIAGAPGMGKSTFAQGLAEFYAQQGKVIKTVEAPRDLILPDNITQYAISHGDAEEIHDILLLSRPDYTFFDEMRNTEDFRLFTDLRLAGVGMIGVVHATRPVDAIQRFMGRIEMGIIPQVIDTVLFIEKGMVGKVLSLNITVKVPSGMTEEDLARPVVEIHDFETGSLEYEIYTFGEQTMVIPVSGLRGKGMSGVAKLASRAIGEEFAKFSPDLKVEMKSEHKAVVYLPEKLMARVIGKEGRRIAEIEKKLGVGIDLRPLNDAPASLQEEAGQSTSQKAALPGLSAKKKLPYEFRAKGNHLIFDIGAKNKSRDVDIVSGGELIVTVKAGAAGMVKIKRRNGIGAAIEQARQEGKEIWLFAD
ncbi:TPA: Flp pilus assembly complex ATPase component TadA [Candidatus Woesearchaeota archaeon]|nr:Flp pilus assembly complex ATPase component TadA [Candidatus Woesearchaeota archaeon]HII69157.1 Flp pilus assembly complex ATPase component TadA [Candidatus Woesearchaeota archaeon]